MLKRGIGRNSDSIFILTEFFLFAINNLVEYCQESSFQIVN